MYRLLVQQESEMGRHEREVAIARQQLEARLNTEGRNQDVD
jgi:hypothetical protein